MTAILDRQPATHRARQRPACDVDGCKPGRGRHNPDCIAGQSRRMPAEQLAYLRRLVGLDPDGPTPEQRARWIAEEHADEQVAA